MALTIFQIVLIGALVLIAPLGFWNMQRRKRKQKEDALFGDDGKVEEESSSNTSTQQTTPNQGNEGGIAPNVEEQIKQYIFQYKTSYSKESIEQGVLAYGITPQQAKMMVDKYFNQ